MTPQMTAVIPAETRKFLLDDLIAKGMPGDAANQQVDLACHAVDEALNAVLSVVQAVDVWQLRIGAHSTALELLSIAAQAHARVIADTARKQASKHGIKVVGMGEA